MSSSTVAQVVKDIFRERHQLCRFLRLNAATNRNLPSFEETPIPPIEVIHKTDAAAPVVQPTQPATLTSPQTSPTSSAGMPTWLKTLIATGALAGTAGGGAGLGYLLSRSDDPAVNTRPHDQSGSLLQDLEDRGYHLPK
jgi:hypothetical protein